MEQFDNNGLIIFNDFQLVTFKQYKCYNICNVQRDIKRNIIL